MWISFLSPSYSHVTAPLLISEMLCVTQGCFLNLSLVADAKKFMNIHASPGGLRSTLFKPRFKKGSVIIEIGLYFVEEDEGIAFF